MWCYWEHLGEHFENLMEIPWEFDGNTLGMTKNKIKSLHPPPNPKMSDKHN
jgi:hypothetical protein